MQTKPGYSGRLRSAVPAPLLFGRDIHVSAFEGMLLTHGPRPTAPPAAVQNGGAVLLRCIHAKITQAEGDVVLGGVHAAGTSPFPR